MKLFWILKCLKKKSKMFFPLLIIQIKVDYLIRYYNQIQSPLSLQKIKKKTLNSLFAANISTI